MLACGHAHQFFYPALFVQHGQVGAGASFRGLFLYPDMPVSESCNLGQVGDADYLSAPGDEGQLLSNDSNVITLSLIGKSATFQRPYYMKSELTAAERDADQRYQDLENYTETLEQCIRALEERIPPEGGNDNG